MCLFKHEYGNRTLIHVMKRSEETQALSVGDSSAQLVPQIFFLTKTEILQ